MRAHGDPAVAAPISALGRVWGLLLVASASPDGLPADAERRLVDFAELVALGLESAEAREQLNASRLRILEAALEEPRRLERNLHDGAQQRLVSLALHLHLLETQLADSSERTRLLVSGARGELELAMKELRELARGLHPAVLTERGLAAGLESLVKGAALQVRIHGAPDERLDEAVEACLYFVAAESITNAVRSGRRPHRHAASGGSRASCGSDRGRAAVEADAGGGNVLRGLAVPDRRS